MWWDVFCEVMWWDVFCDRWRMGRFVSLFLCAEGRSREILGLGLKISPVVFALHRWWRRLLGLSFHSTRRGQRREVHLIGFSGHRSTPSAQAIAVSTGRSRAIAGVRSWSTLWNRNKYHGRSQHFNTSVAAEAGRGWWGKGHNSVVEGLSWGSMIAGILEIWYLCILTPRSHPERWNKLELEEKVMDFVSRSSG
jgi:hypothetical protein